MTQIVQVTPRLGGSVYNLMQIYDQLKAISADIESMEPTISRLSEAVVALDEAIETNANRLLPHWIGFSPDTSSGSDPVTQQLTSVVVTYQDYYLLSVEIDTEIHILGFLRSAGLPPYPTDK